MTPRKPPAADFKFEHAVRKAVKLRIGLAGGTGGGKTYSAMELASGLAGGKRFAFIDSEAERAKHYADEFDFDHGDLQPPFRPQAYLDAIVAAEAAKYPVIVVDSFSHEWEGEGGILEWQEEELDRMAGQDMEKRHRCLRAAWIAPKRAHRKMVNRLLQVRAHLIICLRAEEKIDMEHKDGKLVVVPKKSRTGLDGWIPICEKRLPFELDASFLLIESAPGIPKPIKLENQHRKLINLEKPLDKSVGAALGVWAAGGTPTPPRLYQPDELVQLYKECGRIEYDALETVRRDMWPKLSKQDKQKLKNAADASLERMNENEGKQLDLAGS